MPHAELRRRSSIMEYEQSVLFGQYHEKLASFARLQSVKPKTQKERIREAEKKGIRTQIMRYLSVVGNWPLLICLAIIVSFCSILVDLSTTYLVFTREYLLAHVKASQHFARYIVWTTHSVTLVMVAALITRYISPQAAGSGVAEMKVIIRGVVIKEYLSWRTLVAKLAGVPFVLASGFGLGKEKGAWEEKLNDVVDFSSCHIDPAPLQIMEGTPLSNIHNLFSLLSLQVVYVTSLGRLTGAVSLKDLRKVIENVEKGNVPARNHTFSKDPGMEDVIEEEEEPLKDNSSEGSGEQMA